MTAGPFDTELREGWHDNLDKVRWALRLSWTTSPRLLLLLCLLTIVRGVLPAGVALAGRNLINSVAEALQAPGSSLSPVYLWLAIGMILAVLMSVLGSVQQ